jgi:hypothetical protein
MNIDFEQEVNFNKKYESVLLPTFVKYIESCSAIAEVKYISSAKQLIRSTFNVTEGKTLDFDRVWVPGQKDRYQATVTDISVETEIPKIRLSMSNEKRKIIESFSLHEFAMYSHFRGNPFQDVTRDSINERVNDFVFVLKDVLSVISDETFKGVTNCGIIDSEKRELTEVRHIRFHDPALKFSKPQHNYLTYLYSVRMAKHKLMAEPLAITLHNLGLLDDDFNPTISIQNSEYDREGNRPAGSCASCG